MPELNKQDLETQWDILVRDFTNRGFMAKSEARRRLQEIVNQQVKLARKELLKELEKRIPEKYHQLDGYSPIAYEMGFNNFRDKVLEIINQLKEE